MFFPGLSFGGEGGFTQEDRERLIKLEATLQTFMEQTNKRFEELREDTNKRFTELREDMNKRFEQVDKRFEQVDKRFEEMMTFLKIIVGIFTTLVAVVIGFAYWDRRTIIRKAREETVEYLEREGKVRRLIEALRELAKKDKELAEVLRSFGL
jgi:nitrate reductase NapE component